jgi:hypothetical protein
MLLQDLSKNKKGGIIIIALFIIYMISNNFLFNAILGRLLLVIGLIVTTNCNKILGIILLLFICLGYSQTSQDFEGFSSTSPTTTTTTSPVTTTSPTTTISHTTTLPLTSSPDHANVEDKKRNIGTGIYESSSVMSKPSDENNVVPTADINTKKPQYSQVS